MIGNGQGEEHHHHVFGFVLLGLQIQDIDEGTKSATCLSRFCYSFESIEEHGEASSTAHPCTKHMISESGTRASYHGCRSNRTRTTAEPPARADTIR